MKLKHLLPLVFVLLFAALRWPGLLPPNFSVAYAFVFCAAVFFPRKLSWWLPLVTMAATDVILNVFYYRVSPFSSDLIGNYICYVVLLGLGHLFNPKTHFLKLLTGGILGAILFYVITNTASWLINPFQNPEYTKTLLGWFTALTKGTSGFPATWEFFRNTLISGGLFTGLFAGAVKLLEALEPEEEAEDKPEEEPEQEPEKAEA